jgi:glutathione synthase/RimK-type ligase-like ATP-grasp enzyme
VLWLRRPRGAQEIRHPLNDHASKAVVENDCGGGLRGLLTTAFHGKWISTYEALIRGSDKIGQLFAAALVGWRVPETLVTQSRTEVVDFFRKQVQSGIIVKTVVGAEGPLLLTRKIHDPLEFDEASYEAAPAIYQECIPGRRHLRVLCFGDHSVAASIDSSDLDWRPNLCVPINDWSVPRSVHKKIRDTLDKLGLEMGVIDLKETPDGELVWLEVNPQGQFLFLEPLTKLRLADQFAEYLIETARMG